MVGFCTEDPTKLLVPSKGSVLWWMAEGQAVLCPQGQAQLERGTCIWTLAALAHIKTAHGPRPTQGPLLHSALASLVLMCPSGSRSSARRSSQPPRLISKLHTKAANLHSLGTF